MSRIRKSSRPLAKRKKKQYGLASLIATVATLLLGGPTNQVPMAVAESNCPSARTETWWKHAVLYEIYLRSFQDSNGDGIGDLKGITQRLDYLQALGIDAIWITPCCLSPHVDFGYDVSDYRAIDPRYGNMADMEQLLSEAKRRNIGVLLDLVINHTSEQHPWFLESRGSKINPKRDWYIWRDGKNGGPPINWQSCFGHSAWTEDSATGQWYYHFFYPEQPDLNWRNSEVRSAIYDIMRFWLNKGVSGFRLDAVTTLFEDPHLQDDPLRPGLNAYGDPKIEHLHTDNLPEVHEVCREMRQVVDGYPGAVLVGETYLPSIEELRKAYGHDDEIHLPMNMRVGFVPKLTAPLVRERLREIESLPKECQPLLVFENHDNMRVDRFCDGLHDDAIRRLVATLLLTARGTALLYYGQEIGMSTTPPARKKDVLDPIGKIGWPKEKGRDGERTPMQWNAGKNAGFTSGTKTWLPIPPSHKEMNVGGQDKKADSLLNFYKTVIRLRRANPALCFGNMILVNESDRHVLSYLRKCAKGNAVLVALNMSNQPQTVSFDLRPQGLKGIKLRLLVNSQFKKGIVSLKQLRIAPFEAVIGEVK